MAGICMASEMYTYCSGILNDSPVYSPLGQAKEPRLRARGGPLAKNFQNVWTITMSCIQKQYPSLGHSHALVSAGE